MVKVHKEEKREFKVVHVEGTAMYASVHTPKKAYTAGDPPVYSLDLVVDDENASKLTNEGLKPAKTIVDEDTKKPKSYADHPGKVFSLRRKSMKKDGTSMKPPEVVDANLNPIPQDIMIGNGSRVIASVNPWTVIVSGKEIHGHTLLGVQVIELVPYAARDTSSGFSKSKGFTVPNPSTFSSKLGDEDSSTSPFV